MRGVLISINYRANSAKNPRKTKAEPIKKDSHIRAFFTIPMIIHDIKVICSKSFDLSEELT